MHPASPGNSLDPPQPWQDQRWSLKSNKRMTLIYILDIWSRSKGVTLILHLKHVGYELVGNDWKRPVCSRSTEPLVPARVHFRAWWLHHVQPCLTDYNSASETFQQPWSPIDECLLSFETLTGKECVPFTQCREGCDCARGTHSSWRTICCSYPSSIHGSISLTPRLTKSRTAKTTCLCGCVVGVSTYTNKKALVRHDEYHPTQMQSNYHKGKMASGCYDATQ